ncbi:L-allo-threonine aldolase-like isoform X2 [Convolutriloba macropyga]|uniref:L-allo-threonine aldolase-like isoform X2 n=1 Tax=Convolutriloba macropyga TaxID=536237 RepID=UPI003F524D8B
MSQHGFLKYDIDLRSDTVTTPTAEMRQAMVTAELGNDVFREDPTILSLETKMSTLLGKEKGLFVASGTMGNLLSIMVHCPGSDFDIIVGDKSHINKYEHAGATCVAGVLVKTVPNQSDGTINLEDIKMALNSGTEEHKTKTKMIGLENTHNMCGGVVLNPEYCRAVRQLIENQDIALHLDGARIFNAAVALSVPPSELAAPFDSVSVCLSKDLGAPVGSVLCGSSQFIEQARRLRKMLGGGWAQAGVLAACGLVALDGYETRIALDHNNATVFANKIKQIPGLRSTAIAFKDCRLI